MVWTFKTQQLRHVKVGHYNNIYLPVLLIRSFRSQLLRHGLNLWLNMSHAIIPIITIIRVLLVRVDAKRPVTLRLVSPWRRISIIQLEDLRDVS